jgi:hypothetical protein
MRPEYQINREEGQQNLWSCLYNYYSTDKQAYVIKHSLLRVSTASNACREANSYQFGPIILQISATTWFKAFISIITEILSRKNSQPQDSTPSLRHN